MLDLRVPCCDEYETDSECDDDEVVILEVEPTSVQEEDPGRKVSIFERL